MVSAGLRTMDWVCCYIMWLKDLLKEDLLKGGKICTGRGVKPINTKYQYHVYMDNPTATQRILSELVSTPCTHGFFSV